MGVDDLGYSNTNNPFGDTKLTENFVWSKVSVMNDFNWCLCQSQYPI